MTKAASAQAATEDASSLARRAVALARVRSREERAEAISLARSVTERESTDHATLAAALALYVARDHQAAFEAARRGRHPRAPETAWSFADRLGWFREARLLGEAMAAAGGPGEPRWRARLLALCLRWGDLPSAVVHGSRAVALLPSSPALWLELARALARGGDQERALACTDRATQLGSSTPRAGTMALEAAAVALEAGSPARAERYLRATRDLDRDARALTELARIAAWGVDDELARELAWRALAVDPRASTPHRVLGAVALARGELELAERELELSLRDGPDIEGQLLLAEVALERGHLAVATARLPALFGSREGPPHAISLLRTAILVEGGTDVSRSVQHDLLLLLSDVCPELTDPLGRGEPDAWRAALAAARARIRANRSSTLFHNAPAPGAEGAGLRPAGPRGTARHDARAVLESVRLVEPMELLSRLRAVESAYPRSSLPACHEGELHLWLGQLPEARAALDRSLVLHHGTRWAYIGLTLLECLEGHPERGLAVSARGVEVMHGEGPAVAAYRGEALRLAGRLEEASLDLERAAKSHPDRIAVWPSLGLLRLALGAGSAKAALAELSARAPGLLSDAARTAGVSFDGDATDPRTARALFEAALGMLRGNRSSTCVTYFSPEGVLRSVSRGGPGPHAGDEADLGTASALLA